MYIDIEKYRSASYISDIFSQQGCRNGRAEGAASPLAFYQQGQEGNMPF